MKINWDHFGVIMMIVSLVIIGTVIVVVPITIVAWTFHLAHMMMP